MDETLLNNLAKEKGLIFLGIVSLDVEKDFNKFKEWISSKYHGELKYLERNFRLRLNPKLLFPIANSAMIFGLSVNLKTNSPIWKNVKIARFARFYDYHKKIKKSLLEIANTIFNNDRKKFFIFCDTSPVLERSLALKTGRGFIGKNCCYIDYEYGSFLMLGGILSEIEPNINSMTNQKNYCENCDLCIKNCPFQAFVKPYVIDVRKCFAYLSTTSTNIPHQYLKYFKEYFWGCDECQEVCPYNKKAAFCDGKDLIKNWPSLRELAFEEASTIKELIKSSVFEKNIGLIKRNALFTLNG